MSAPVLQINDLTVRLPSGADRENAIDDVNIHVGYRPFMKMHGRIVDHNVEPAELLHRIFN